MIDAKPQSHAALDSDSRVRKAMKIGRLLSQVTDLQGACVLEIGAGAGYIASFLASRVGAGGAVSAVDIIDQRQVCDGFDFRLVSDTALPFDDDSFDICVSNHVLEHVGDPKAQAAHLREIQRVLRPAGWLYLAVPNRWALIEPHFKLPLLSWLPPSLRDTYVRITGRGQRYDCHPPTHAELEALLHGAGYRTREVSFEGIKAVGDIETGPGLKRWLCKHPRFWALPLRVLLPSHLYLARYP
ncbi:Methyltransferase type 11 [Nitrosococcus halophilus Nc 4]|uniref:Methyltransferase type 11 n=1 Tax=Nitrosococcus halophilus (strain Nc4) TaxID=472759 RepID=D5BVE5_NITHN|nr:class I SAM-dependent methyltransferase [Nitrosococcus halophilus]ADE13573.1 Methyltransferase type 11 [Nitrosococcus halophilus Nc 4]